MPQGYIEAILLYIVTFVAYIAILVALEALGDYIVSFEELIVIQLILLDQPSVYQAIHLLQLSDTNDQQPYCTTRLEELFYKCHLYDFHYSLQLQVLSIDFTNCLSLALDLVDLDSMCYYSEFPPLHPSPNPKGLQPLSVGQLACTSLFVFYSHDHVPTWQLANRHCYTSYSLAIKLL